LNRDKWEVWAQMLTVIAHNGNARKTQVVYGANMSWSTVNRHFKMLSEHGLITINSPYFQITPKGEKFLALYQVIAKLFRET